MRALVAVEMWGEIADLLLTCFVVGCVMLVVQGDALPTQWSTAKQQAKEGMRIAHQGMQGRAGQGMRTRNHASTSVRLSWSSSSLSSSLSSSVPVGFHLRGDTMAQGKASSVSKFNNYGH